MANTRYGHFLKTDFITKGLTSFQQKGKGEFVAWPTGSELEGLNINFALGAINRVGKWLPEKQGLHIHPFDECLIFSGFSYNNPGHLGAEVEIGMGEDGEKYLFDTPTVVVIPRGLPHSQPITRRADNPFAVSIISLDAEHKTTWLSRKNNQEQTSQRKYENFVRKMPMRDAKRKTGGNADFIFGAGGKDLEGFSLNFTWAFHTGLGDWHPGLDPHVHPYDEFLVFFGLDADNPDYLGAEIEIAMGQELEKHVFDTPTIVVVPGGLIHCPLVTRSVEKPYGFSAICLNGEHQTTWLGKDKPS